MINLRAVSPTTTPGAATTPEATPPTLPGPTPKACAKPSFKGDFEEEDDSYVSEMKHHKQNFRELADDKETPKFLKVGAEIGAAVASAFLAGSSMKFAMEKSIDIFGKFIKSKGVTTVTEQTAKVFGWTKKQAVAAYDKVKTQPFAVKTGEHVSNIAEKVKTFKPVAYVAQKVETAGNSTFMTSVKAGAKKFFDKKSLEDKFVSISAGSAAIVGAGEGFGEVKTAFARKGDD